MDNALTPREIQARIRSGASVDDVAGESGMEVAHIEAFAGPVLAEREHMAGAAQTATIRRRGEAGSHRRLGDLITSRLRSRGLDADEVRWDAWRQSDLKWRIVARLGGQSEAEAREAEFVFDPKARFSVAHNADAKWMIGEELPGATPEEENTVDFNDELALVRAVSTPDPESPGDDVPASELMHEGNEDTSQLDRLYDMLSGISEDSVRIYTGILDPVLYETPEAAEPTEPTGSETTDSEADEPTRDLTHLGEPVDEPPAEDAQEQRDDEPTGTAAAPSAADIAAVAPVDQEAPPESEEAAQDALVEPEQQPVRAPKPRKRRAKVPSWDEIMFGGPTPK